MGSFPALSIRPPENPLDMYARVFQIKHLQQASQAQDIQNRMLQETYADDQRLRSVFAQGADHPEWQPEDYMRAAQEQSVGPQGMAWLRQTAIQSQQALSSLGQEQLKVLDGVNSKLQGYTQDVLEAPAEEKLQTQQRSKAQAISLVTSTQGLNPYIRKELMAEIGNIPDDQYVGDDAMALFMGRHNLSATLAERALKQAQTSEAGGKAAQSFAEAQKIQGAATPGSPFYSPTPAYLAGQAQAGNVGAQQTQAGLAAQAGAVAGAEAKAKLPYEIEARRAAAEAQVQAQTRMYAGNSALAKVPPHLVAPATADATKVAQEYADATSAADDMRKFIAEARAGNKIAYAYSPTEGVLTLNTARGVKRVNMPEIHSYAGAGSAWDRVTGFLGKQASGASIPADVLNDMEALHTAIASNAQTKYTNKLKSINQNYGSNFQPVQMETAPAAGNRPPLSSFEH